MNTIKIYPANTDNKKTANLARRNGDTPEAFKVFYNLYAGRVHRYCLFRTNSYQDAEDITAEVFIKYLNAKNRPLLSDHALPWLFRVASNHCDTITGEKIKGGCSRSKRRHFKNHLSSRGKIWKFGGPSKN